MKSILKAADLAKESTFTRVYLKKIDVSVLRMYAPHVFLLSAQVLHSSRCESACLYKLPVLSHLSIWKTVTSILGFPKLIFSAGVYGFG